MGWFHREKHEQEKEVFAPISGSIRSLASLKDGVFSEGLLGEGCVIDPQSQTLYAPFDGRVTMEVESGHAIGLMSDQGVEVLLHVGLETVAMAGAGFHYMVKEGDAIRKGEALMSFSKAQIAAAGCQDSVILIVSNTKQFSAVKLLAKEYVKQTQPLLSVR